MFMTTPEHAILNPALPSGSKTLNKEIDHFHSLVIAAFVFQCTAIEKPSACRQLVETLDPLF